MPASAIIDIQASKSGTGITDTTDEVTKLGYAMEGTDGKVQGLLRRMERPMGRTLFASLATEALGVSSAAGAASGQAMVLERGFHTLGIAAAFLGGPLGEIALIGAGLIAMFMKLTESADNAKDVIEKKVKTLRDEADGIRESAKALQKHSQISKEDYDTAIKLAQAKEDLIKSTQKETEADLEQSKGGFQQLTWYQKLHDVILSQGGALNTATMAKERYNTATMAELGLGKDLEELDKKKEEAHKKEEEALRKQAEATKKYVDDMEKAYNKHAETVKKTAESIARDMDKFNSSVASSFSKTNGQIVFDYEKFAKDMVKETADMISKQLVMWGSMDIATGNFGKGAAELAASAAVAALGGAAEAALGPESGSSLTTGNLSGAMTSAPSSLSSGGTVGNTQNLNVTIAGGIPDQNSITAIVDGINRYVQGFNGTVVASVTKPAVGQIAGV